jgi:hypothetical protein
MLLGRLGREAAHCGNLELLCFDGLDQLI